jgi:hypothetical protein
MHSPQTSLDVSKSLSGMKENVPSTTTPKTVMALDNVTFGS